MEPSRLADTQRGLVKKGFGLLGIFLSPLKRDHKEITNTCTVSKSSCKKIKAFPGFQNLANTIFLSWLNLNSRVCSSLIKPSDAGQSSRYQTWWCGLELHGSLNLSVCYSRAASADVNKNKISEDVDLHVAPGLQSNLSEFRFSSIHSSTNWHDLVLQLLSRVTGSQSLRSQNTEYMNKL